MMWAALTQIAAVVVAVPLVAVIVRGLLRNEAKLKTIEKLHKRAGR